MKSKTAGREVEAVISAVEKFRRNTNSIVSLRSTVKLRMEKRTEVWQKVCSESGAGILASELKINSRVGLA